MKSVVIIDCGIGNHRSVQNALTLLNVATTVTSDPTAIAEADYLILPGVGSFGEGMDGMRERNLIEPVTDAVMRKRTPILGICLGMKMFATTGLEHGEHRGLSFIPGTVVKVPTSLRLPHIGWNNVQIIGNHSITKNYDREPIFYFVHSYHLVPDDPSVVAGTCDYGAEVVAIVQKGNVMGTQFHPEKSHEDGLQIFRNFLDIAK